MSKRAVDSSNFTRPTVSFPNARTALKAFLLGLGLSPDDKVLLPAYVGWSEYEGSGVFDPIREVGVRFEFYRLTRGLVVDLDDLRTKIATGRPRLLLVIHYFGFPQPGAVFDLLDMANQPVYVIEDATHSWLSRPADGRLLGQRGAITVCSPRKFFPVPDGGMAVVGDSKSYLDPQVAAIDWRFAFQRTTGLLLRWLFAKTQAKSVNRLAFSLLRRAERKLDTAVSVSKASWISKRVLLNLDFDAAAERRRQNYKTLSEGVRAERLPVQPLFEELPIGVVPLGFPILCERREALRAFLIERRVYPPIHWLLPREYGIFKFQHLIDLSEHILTFPIDQRYGPEDMEYILACLAEWRSFV